MNERNKYMNAVYETGFALDEAILYLDTHPCDEKAQEYFNKMQCAYQKAHCEYTDKFGPLLAKEVNVENRWDWVVTPWPWEVEGC